MQTGSRPPYPIRFGDFELDTRAGEVRRNGSRIRLGQNSLHVLIALLDQSGKVVTREELRKTLWPEDTFVDFEDGLNHAVRKLREALGDDAETPRYIETLPRRGYRFIAPTEAARAVALVSPPAGEAEAPVYDRRPGITARRAALQARWPFVAAVLTLFATYVALLFRTPAAPRVLGIRQITHTAHEKDSHFVTDGTRIYFSEYIGSHLTPMAVAAAGGDAVPILTGLQDAVVVGITADDSQLTVGSLNPLTPDGHPIAVWRVPVLGGSRRRVGDLVVDCPCTTDTPDGRGLLYSKGSGLYFANADGSGSRMLLSAPGLPHYFRYAPNNSYLRFSVYNFKQRGSSIWEASPDGSNLHRFLVGWNRSGSECCGTWTPEGKWFVFQAEAAGSPGLWALHEGRFFGKGGREPVQLTSGPMRYESPILSKDGKKIFFLGTQTHAELSVYDLRLREFVPYLGGIPAEGVAFSRDGQWVAYVRLPEGTLWRMKADGSDPLQLTFPPLRVYLPRWSPDGKRIAFYDIPPHGNSRIYLIAKEGGTPEPVTSGEHNEQDPTWSPDGKSLVFSYGIDSPETSIQVLNLKTHQVAELPGSKGFYSPRWSPDGRHIAALTYGDFQLMLFDLNTQSWRRLGVKAGFTNWSRDSKYVSFFWGKPKLAFFRVEIATGRAEGLAGLGNARPAHGVTGFMWLGVTPDGSPLIAREAGTEEIYALDVDFP